MAGQEPAQEHEEESDYTVARGRLIVSSVILSLSVAYGILASDLALGTAVRPGPAVFPLAVAALTGVLALGGCMEGLRDFRAAQAAEEGKSETAQDIHEPSLHLGARGVPIGTAKVVAYTSGLIVFVWATPRLGFLPATIAVMWFLAGLVSGTWRSWRTAVFAIFSAFAVWIVFSQLFDIRLPRGLLSTSIPTALLGF